MTTTEKTGTSLHRRGSRGLTRFINICINCSGVSVSPSASVPPDDGNTPVLIGCLVTIILLLVVIIFLILWCQFVCKVLEKVRRSLCVS